MEYIQMTYEEWLEQYKPLLNVDGTPLVFETYGVDYEELKEKNRLTIWTVEDIDGETAMFSGFHWVNRLHYHITTVPFKEEQSIAVVMPQEEEDLDEIDVDSPEWTCHWCTETNVVEPPMADGMHVECENCGEKFILRICRKKETGT